jgi:hypothetical protein
MVVRLEQVNQAYGELAEHFAGYMAVPGFFQTGRAQAQDGIGMPNFRQMPGVANPFAQSPVDLPSPGLAAPDYMARLYSAALGNRHPDLAAAYSHYVVSAARFINEGLEALHPAMERPAPVEQVIAVNLELMKGDIPYLREEQELEEGQDASLPLAVVAATDMLAHMPLAEAKEKIGQIADMLGEQLQDQAYGALKEAILQQLGLEEGADIATLLHRVLEAIGDAPLSAEDGERLSEILSIIAGVHEVITEGTLPEDISPDVYFADFGPLVEMSDELLAFWPDEGPEEVGIDRETPQDERDLLQDENPMVLTPEACAAAVALLTCTLLDQVPAANAVIIPDVAASSVNAPAAPAARPLT